MYLVHHRSRGQYIHPKMFRIAFIISSPFLPSITWLLYSDYYWMDHFTRNNIHCLSSGEYKDTNLTRKGLWKKPSRFLPQIPRREVIVFSLNYLVSGNLLQQRRLLTSSWAPHFLANNKRLGSHKQALQFP